MGLFNVNRTNSEILASRRPSETLQNRDVFETQQMERSTLGKPQTPTSRIVLTVIAGVLIAILAWLLASFYQFFVDGGVLEFLEISQTRQHLDLVIIQDLLLVSSCSLLVLLVVHVQFCMLY